MARHGTGLALYIANPIVDAHSGQIFGYNNKQARRAVLPPHVDDENS